jgi:hypothetical protein
MTLKFVFTGKFLIAAGSTAATSGKHLPVLYMGVINKNDWGINYPVSGSFNTAEEAATAAQSHAIRILNHKEKGVPLPV